MTPTVAYLLKKFPRTSETFILNEMLGQESLGARLTVLSRRPPDDEPRHPQLARLQAPVEVLPHSKEVDPWLELFGPGADPGLLGRVRAVVDGFAPLGHPRFPSLLSEAVYLLRRTRELGVEHVHAHFATDGAVVAALLAALGGPGYSLTLHAKDIYRSTVDPAVLDRLIAGSRFSVTVCDANVAHIRSLVSERAAARVRRLYNGIQLSAFAADGRTRDGDHVLSVGRLVEKKGFDVLVEALAALRDSGRTFRATIVGDGEDRPRIEAAAARAGLSDRVSFTGALDQGEVAGLLRRATVFCLPCVIGEDGNRDALPTVLLEALAAGLPCVSTPVTGIPEILDGGRAGRLVPERDPQATARALAELLDDPGERAGIARAGLRHAAEHFDLGETARTLRGWMLEACRQASAQAREATCTSRA